MRDTGQELLENGHHEAWQGLSARGQGGGKYWDPAWVSLPCVFCSGPNSAGRPGGLRGEAQASDWNSCQLRIHSLKEVD